MSTAPLISFRAGMCQYNDSGSPPKVKPQETPGLVYLYSDDDLIHFCWRSRDASEDEPELDLVMVPTDGQFLPYRPQNHPSGKTNGRIFVLKFASSSARHFFWLQSASQSVNNDASWMSPRDLKIGQIVHELLQGEDVDIAHELSQVRGAGNRRSDDDDDETMEDVEGHGDRNQPHTGGGGGAGPGATGGDVREEGENAREGGSDGARA